jgi:hypothetical protein
MEALDFETEPAMKAVLQRGPEEAPDGALRRVSLATRL